MHTLRLQLYIALIARLVVIAMIIILYIIEFAKVVQVTVKVVFITKKKTLLNVPYVMKDIH